MRILVIRFRQMGDAILATPLLSTLKKNIPDAEIDFVLNERIAPLFEGHPALHRIITFTDKERHSTLTYIKKVWRTVHQTRYDVIIDMRSTVNTMLFALFSLRSKRRIGIRKPYTWGIFNRRIEGCEDNESMISHNLKLAEQVTDSKMATYDRNLTLTITEQEQQDFRNYMASKGIDFARPVMLVGVTAKLESKTWPEDRMTEVLTRFIRTFPQWQLIFNYAPGREAENASRIFTSIAGACSKENSLSSKTSETSKTSNASKTSHSRNTSIFLDIEAKTPRQLAAMAANCTAYFGNEGGARHIVHAMGRPSLVICSPAASKTTWLPQDTDIRAEGIDGASYGQITTDRVWDALRRFTTEIS